MQRDSPKVVVSWAMYDWANSAFATTVMAGFFPVFFKQFWSSGVDAPVSTARLGYGISIAGIIIALGAPILGAIADRGTAKKRFLLGFACLGVMTTSSLYLVSAGNWHMALVLYALGTIGFSGANVFYDSLLPAVSSEGRMDFTSSLGFSLGYLGGGILFAINVWMALNPTFFGFSDPSQSVRFSFLTVGIWWALFSLPLFMFVREPVYYAKPKQGLRMVRAGLGQLIRTFREIRHMKTIFLFLVAYWLYIDGVDTIIRMAVDYGLSLGFHSNDLIVALLATQFVGFPAAVCFGFLGTFIGTKRSILIAIGVYLFVTVWAAFIRTKGEFFALAILIGLVQGGIQALSRSFYAKIIPEEKSAEYFGFYNMLGKFAVIIGPALIGSFALLLRSFGVSSIAASRSSITAVSLLFLSGGALLFYVDETRGKQEAQHLSQIGGT